MNQNQTKTGYKTQYFDNFLKQQPIPTRPDSIRVENEKGEYIEIKQKGTFRLEKLVSWVLVIGTATVVLGVVIIGIYKWIENIVNWPARIREAVEVPETGNSNETVALIFLLIGLVVAIYLIFLFLPEYRANQAAKSNVSDLPTFTSQGSSRPGSIIINNYYQINNR